MCVGHSFVSRDYYSAYHSWAPNKSFEAKLFRWHENDILRLSFANTLFHKRTILLAFEAEFKENSLEILLYLEPTNVGPGENMSKQRFSDGWKRLC